MIALILFCSTFLDVKTLFIIYIFFCLYVTTGHVGALCMCVRLLFPLRLLFTILPGRLNKVTIDWVECTKTTGPVLNWTCNCDLFALISVLVPFLEAYGLFFY